MNKEKFRNKNLQIASYLYASGLQFFIDRTNKREVYFVFISKSEAEKLIHIYFAGNAKVDPKDLFNKQEELKDQIFLEVDSG